jgi:hypothetical protein
MGVLTILVAGGLLTAAGGVAYDISIEVGGALLGALGTVLAGGCAAWYAVLRWRRGDFLDRINISLNSVVNGRLLIRTLYESDLTSVFLNKEAVRLVREAAKWASESGDPILRERDGKDHWRLLNSVLNVISEKFATGFLRRDLGYRVDSRRYLVFLTFEPDERVQTKKIRAMVVQEETLDLFGEHGRFAVTMPGLEDREHHAVRVQTLRQMAQRRKADPGCCISVEVCVPGASAKAR